jgi:hypothetical protein
MSKTLQHTLKRRGKSLDALLKEPLWQELLLYLLGHNMLVFVPSRLQEQFASIRDALDGYQSGTKRACLADVMWSRGWIEQALWLKMQPLRDERRTTPVDEKQLEQVLRPRVFQDRDHGQR